MIEDSPNLEAYLKHNIFEKCFRILQSFEPQKCILNFPDWCFVQYSVKYYFRQQDYFYCWRLSVSYLFIRWLILVIFATFGYDLYIEGFILQELHQYLWEDSMWEFIFPSVKFMKIKRNSAREQLVQFTLIVSQILNLALRLFSWP